MLFDVSFSKKKKNKKNRKEEEEGKKLEVKTIRKNSLGLNARSSRIDVTHNRILFWIVLRLGLKGGGGGE